jgi:hypothetical protein
MMQGRRFLGLGFFFIHLKEHIIKIWDCTGRVVEGIKGVEDIIRS